MTPQLRLTSITPLLTLIFLGTLSGRLPAQTSAPSTIGSAEVTQTLKKFDYDQSREKTNQIEQTILNLAPEKKAEYEKALLAVITDTTAKQAGRAEAARLDAWVAGPDSVAALAMLLDDKFLSQNVRGVYELIIRQQTGPSHDAAIQALLKAAGESKAPQTTAGLLNSLGLSRDAQVVPFLSESAQAKDPVISGAAIKALGLDGTSASAQALLKLPPASLNVYEVGNALTVCIQHLIETDKNSAQALAQALASASGGAQQAAAWLAEQKIQGHTDPVSLAKALDSTEPKVAQAAVGWVARYGSDAIPASLQIFSKLSESAQAEVLGAWAERRDPSTASLVTENLTSKNGSIQLAAIYAAGELHLAAAGPELIKLVNPNTELGKEALFALGKIPSPDLDKQLLGMMEAKDASPAILALCALDARKNLEAIGHLDNPVLYGQPAGVAAAVSLIKTGANQTNFAQLLIWSTTSIPEGARDRVVNALGVVAHRLPDKDKSLQDLQKAAAASPDAKATLLDLFTAIGSPAALAVISEDLKSSDVETRKNAIRSLEKFGGIKEAELLLAQVASDSDPSAKILALRAACNIAGRENSMSVTEAVTVLKAAETAATRSEERGLAVASLGNWKGPEVLALAQEWTSQSDIAEAAQALVNKLQKK